jgi:hypothetical protein
MRRRHLPAGAVERIGTARRADIRPDRSRAARSQRGNRRLFAPAPRGMKYALMRAEHLAEVLGVRRGLAEALVGMTPIAWGRRAPRPIAGCLGDM